MRPLESSATNAEPVLSHTRMRDEEGAQSALGIFSEQVLSAACAPLNLLLAAKSLEDSKKSSRLDRQENTQVESLKRELKNDLEMAKSLQSFQKEAASLLQGGFTTASLFLRGRVGLGASLVSFALDEWRPFLPIEKQGADVALGALKGAGLKAVFAKFGMLDPAMKLVPTQLNLPLRATVLGASSRAVSAGLTRENWEGSTGSFDGKKGCLVLSQSVLNPLAVCTDIAAFGFTAGLQGSLNKLTKGAVERSPLLATSLTGAGFGFSVAASSEAIRQHSANEKIDPGKILTQALLHAAVDSIAAAPAGMQAEREALQMYNKLGLGLEVKKIPPFTSPESIDAKSLPKQIVTDAKDICCTHYPGKDLKPLEIKVQELTLKEKKDLLGDARNQHEALWRKKTTSPGDYKSEEEFLAANGVLRAETMDIYKPKGMSLELAVPSKYNAELDAVRQTRVSAGPTNDAIKFLNTQFDSKFAHRALPEDIAALLNEVPNNRLIRRVNLLGNESPLNGYRISKAEASTCGDTITYFEQNYDARLRESTNHEWAHVLHNKRPELLRKFQKAVIVEDALNSNNNLRDYARFNSNENWAVHLGEGILSPELRPLLEMSRYAPIRLSVLGRALRNSLTEGEQANTSVYKSQLLARADFIEKHIDPIAIKQLRNEIRNPMRCTEPHVDLFSFLSRNESEIRSAKEAALQALKKHMLKSDRLGTREFDLLLHLAPEKSTVDFIKPLVPKMGFREEAALPLSGMKLLDGNPLAQYKFLYALLHEAAPDPRLKRDPLAVRRSTSSAVYCMTPYMIESYYKPKIEVLRVTHPGSRELADHLENLDIWYSSNSTGDSYEIRRQILNEAFLIRAKLPDLGKAINTASHLTFQLEYHNEFQKAIDVLSQLRELAKACPDDLSSENKAWLVHQWDHLHKRQKAMKGLARLNSEVRVARARYDKESSKQ